MRGSKKMIALARRWSRELREHGVSPFVGWLLTGAFSLYLVAVLTAHALRRVGILPPTYTLPVWIGLFALAVAGVCLCGKPFVKRFADGPSPTVPPWKVGVGAFLLYFAGLVVLQLGWAPPDTLDQMQQVHDFRFNDWHPVLHTFSLYLITRIHDSLFAVACVQAISLSALVAWLYRTLLRTTTGRIAGLVTLWIALNPVNFTMLRSVAKGSAFALSALGVCIAVLNVAASRGEWLKRNGNVVLLAILLFLATFYRHNGIFFTAPLCLGLVFVRMPWKARFRLFASLAAFALLGAGYWSVKRSDYLVSCGVLDVQRDRGQRFAESIGLPMCGMLGAYVNAYERMPDDARDFITHFGKREKILEAYRGDYNSVKFKAKENAGKGPTRIIMESTDPKALLGMFFRTARAAPRDVMRAILHVTSLVWDPMQVHAAMGVPVSLFRRDFFCPIAVLMETPVGCLFGSVGFWMLVFVGIATVGFVYRGRTAWLFSLPWLCYGFGTMLLLCGEDWRFFYAVVLCAPISLSCFFLRRPRGDAKPEEKT